MDAEPPDREPGPSEAVLREEFAAAVHEELARLPDRYRLPVMLCDLEGETQPAAAARLGWPVGSVAGRLNRARALLRDRLTRRGFAPAGSLLVLPLAAVPGRVLSAAVAAATGTGPPTVPVSLLATGVVSTMRAAKLKLLGVVLVTAGLIGAAGFGAYTAAAQPSVARTPAVQPVAPAAGKSPSVVAEGDSVTAFPELAPKDLEDLVTSCPRLFGPADEPTPKDDALRHLQVARLNAARAGLRAQVARWQIGRFDGPSTGDVVAMIGRAADAAADLHTARDVKADAARLRPWFEERVRVTKWLERVLRARIQAGAEPPGGEAVARVARLDAEIALLRLLNGERAANRLP